MAGITGASDGGRLRELEAPRVRQRGGPPLPDPAHRAVHRPVRLSRPARTAWDRRRHQRLHQRRDAMTAPPSPATRIPASTVRA